MAKTDRNIHSRIFHTAKEANRYWESLIELEDSTLIKSWTVPEKVRGGYRVMVELNPNFNHGKFIDWWLNFNFKRSSAKG